MIKTTMMLSIKVMSRFLRNIIILFFVLVGLLLLWLKIGIHADFLSFRSYKVSGLYIKLDKKLVLTAHDIHIPQSKEKPSFEAIDKTFEWLEGILYFFDYIALHEVVYKNNQIDFVFADNLLHINTKDYEIAGKIEHIDQRFIAEVPLLYLKSKKISLFGKLTYNHLQDRLHTWGGFWAYGIEGKFVFGKVKSKVTFDLLSDTFTDLEPLMRILPFKPVVKEWSVERIKAKRYKLLSLKGEGRAVFDTFKLSEETLTGTLELEEVGVNFRDTLDPLMAQKIELNYKEGGLYFTLHHPMYQEKSLEGSAIAILDVAGNKPTHLALDLRIKSPLDASIHQILNAYKLTVPVLQTSGTAESKVALDVVFKDLETTAVVDVNFTDSHLVVGTLPLTINSGFVHYQEGNVTLQDIMLQDVMYSAKVNGNVSLAQKKIDLKADIAYLGDGDEEGKKMFQLRDKELFIAIDYQKGTKVSVPKLGFTLNKESNQTKISLADLMLIKPYLKESSLIQQGGSMEILTDDFSHFSFEGILKRETCFFYERDDLCHTKVPYLGTFTPKGVDFYAFNKHLHYNESNARVTLDGLNIDLEKFINYTQGRHEEGTILKDKNKSLVIVGKQSHLRYQQYKLLADSYDVEIKPKGELKAIGSSDGDIVKFEKKGNIFSLNALRIKDKTLHPLINFDGLKEGRYSLKQSGDINKIMHGRIIVEGGVMRDFSAYNNTIALINTLPALATLQNPGFSSKGYKIEEGVIEYRMIKDEKIIFDSIYIKGASSTLVGEGEIDLKNHTIDIKLAIQTAKEFGKVLGSIPLLGYILMGEDKSVVIGLTISGMLDQPKVKTTAAQSVLTLPFRMIKRIFESPIQIIDESKMQH